MNATAVFDSTFCVHLTLTLAHFLWQGLAVALAAAGCAWICRRASAQARYVIFAVALVLMTACLPMTFAFVHARAGAQTAVLPEEASMPPAALGPGASEALPPNMTTETWLIPPMTDGGTVPAGRVAAAGPELPIEEDLPRFRWERLTPYTAIAYFAGVIAMLGRLLVKLCGGQRLRRSARPVEADLAELVKRQARVLGLRLAPAVAYCERVAVPVVVGIIRPMILLPASLASGLTPEEIRGIVLHELTHIRRYDHLVNLLQHVVEAILFFHPAVWYVSRRIRVEREYCCDDAVLAAGGQRLEYAGSLVRVAELGCRSRGLAPCHKLVALASSGQRPSRLRRRILRLLAYPEVPEVRLTAGSTLLLAIVLAVGLSVPLAMFRPAARAETGAPDEQQGRSTSEEDRQRDETPAGPLKGGLPDVGTVELLGLIRSSDKEAGWWAPDGSPIAAPQVQDADLKDLGTIAAFRLAPADLRLKGYFLKGSHVLEFKDTWPGSGDGIVLGAIDHPEGRRFGNLLVSVQAPGRPLYTFPLKAEDAGGPGRVDKYGVQAFTGMVETGPSQFRVTVLHSSDVRKEHLAAVDRDDELHVPAEISQQRGNYDYSTTLTFGFPMERLAGIALMRPTRFEAGFRNVALQPSIEANPVAVVRDYRKRRPEQEIREPLEVKPPFRAQLPNDLTVELLGVVRYSDAGLTWWAPDGGPIAPVAGVLEADVEGYGDVLAIRIQGEGGGFISFTERGGGRVRVEGGSYVRPPGIWLSHVDPTGRQDETTLVMEMEGGKAKTILTVPVTADELAKGEKIVDQGALEKITRIEPVTPEACKVTLVHRIRSSGLSGIEFMAMDEAGEVHMHTAGSFYGERRELTFPIPADALVAIAVQQQGRAEVRFAGISLEPGHRTQVTSQVKDLTARPTTGSEPAPPTRPEAADEPLRVSGRVTDAKTGKPIERFTIVPGHDYFGAGNVFFDWRKAEPFTGGQYTLTLQPPRFATRPPKLVQFVRVEAEGYPPAVSRAIEPSEGQVLLDFQLDEGSGIAGVVQDQSGTPLPDAAVVVCLTTRWTQISDNEVRLDNTNTVGMKAGPGGRFLVSAGDDAHAVLAIHDAGIGLVTIEDLRASGKLVVEPWAKVEGVFRIGEDPAPDQTIELQFTPMRERARRHNGQILISYRATTDPSGRFVFPQVPGMEGRLGRQVIIKRYDHGYMSTRGPARNVAPEPGQSLQVDLGGEGRPVVGRLRLPEWFKEPFDWTWSTANLRMVEPEPPYPDGLTSKEKRDWYETWKRTDAGRAHWLADRDYGFKLEPDGSFRVDNVVAAKYELRITLHYPPADEGDRFRRIAGALKHEFTVSEVPPPTSVQPLDLGELEVPITRLPNGEPAEVVKPAS